MFTGYVSPMQPVTAHTWTLSIELICDLIMLLIFRFFKKKKWPFYIMLCIGIAWRTITIAIGLNNYVVSLCPLAHFDSFALGALLAIKAKENVRKTWFNIVALLIGTLGILSCVFVTSLLAKQSIIDSYKSYSFSSSYLSNVYTGNIYIFISFLSLGIIGLLCKTLNDKTNLMNRLFVKFGDSSYYMYLFHWPFLFLLTKFLKDWYVTLPIVLAFSILSSLVFSKIIYLIKEKKTTKSIRAE